MKEQQDFHIYFFLSKTDLFEVSYYHCGGNEDPYFTTRAAKFTKGKRDYIQCGQAQESILPPYQQAYDFYKKWDKHHLKKLTDEQYNELVQDIRRLTQTYAYHYKNGNNELSFFEVVELSKLKPKQDFKTKDGYYQYITKQLDNNPSLVINNKLSL